MAFIISDLISKKPETVTVRNTKILNNELS